MEPELQRRVQRYGWDKAASFYETFWGRQLEPAQTTLIEMAALREGESVLDVACGTGLVTFRVAEAVSAKGSVLGTDISDRMVELAHSTAAEKGLHHVRFERMDAEELHVADCSFDSALCALGLMYVPDARKAISEMYRATKHGGRVVAAVWGQRSRCGWAEIFPIVDRRVKSEVCPLFFQLGTAEILKLSFEGVGCTDVVSKRILTVLEYASPDEACGAAFAGGPVALAYSKFNDTMKEEARAEYLESIEPFKKGNAYSVPGEFVIAIGRKL